MTDAAPMPPYWAEPPRRDRRMVVTALASVALHLLLLGSVVLPRAPLPPPAVPQSVDVELVPPVRAAEPPPSQAPPSEAPSSAELAPAASEAPSSTSEPASAAPVPVERPVVIPVVPSIDSSAETSSLPNSSVSEEASSAAEDSASAASEPASADASGEASEIAEASALTTTDTGASDAVAAASSGPAPEADSAGAKPIVSGALHTAKRFYLDAILSTAVMARARDAIRALPPDKRLAQTCNIEAIGQLGNAGKGYMPDALVADALAKPVIAGSSFTVVGGAFRSGGKWRAISYACTLSPDLSAVKSFSYRVGGDVTAALKAKVGG